MFAFRRGTRVLLNGPMRRLLSVILLFIIAGAAGWTLYRWNRDASVTSDPWRAVPERAAIVVSIPDAFITWDRFTHTSQLWTAFSTLPGAAAADRLLAGAVARMENDEALRGALRNTKVLAAVMRNGGDALGCLFVGTPGTKDAAPLKAFGELLGLDATALQALTKGEVVQVRPDTALPTLSFCVREGAWLLASSPATMDEALLQWRSGRSLAQDSLFAHALGTLGAGSDAHVLLRPDRLKDLALLGWKADAVEGAEAPEGWLAMDLRTRPDAVLLSGLLLGVDGTPWSIALQSQEPGPWSGARVIPTEAVTYSTRQVSDPLAFLKNKGLIQDSTWVGDLFHWVQGSVGLAHSASPNSGPWGLFGTNGPESAEERLSALCPQGCDTLGYRGIRVQRLPRSHMHAELLGPEFEVLGRAWWAVLGDVVVFAPEAKDIQHAVDAWLDGNSLAEDGRTAAWWSRMASTGGAGWWCDVARATPLLAEAARPSMASIIDSLPGFWSSFGGLSIQMSPGHRGSIHVTAALQFAPLKEQPSNERWQVALGAPASRPPQIVVNHTNGTQEVLVQDDLHRLHLIGTTGKVLWSRTLASRILGEVQQVDRFRNGKLQLLFATAEGIHLIDRNGKDVGGFPVRTDGPISAPLAVFDYEGDGEYRILVTLQNGVVMNNAMDGQPVKGWERPVLRAPAACAVHHLRIRNKDHLVVVDTLKHVRVLDRRGSDRERTKLELGVGPKVLSIAPGNDISSSAIIWADPEGRLWHGLLSGEHRQWAAASTGSYLTGPVGSDGERLVAHVGRDSVALFQGERVLFRRHLPGCQALGAGFHEQQDGMMVLSIPVPEAEELHLFRMDGSTVTGTPIAQAGPGLFADLDRDGRQELITLMPSGMLKCLPMPNDRSK